VSGITPTRFGYQFCGWKINGSGDTLQAGSSFTMPANDVTLVAQWEATSSKSYKMEQGVGYTYNGAFRIKGDPSNYQDKITFYVPKAGEYTFE
ncbi:MAG: InlB B-repeat-containing protein, partial [Clostridiaceae bacterium]|nr:InlB B-repeat-containing protein [Clostridiaceae bacterium]